LVDLLLHQPFDEFSLAATFNKKENRAIDDHRGLVKLYPTYKGLSSSGWRE
jgi:hypothetical protein